VRSISGAAEDEGVLLEAIVVVVVERGWYWPWCGLMVGKGCPAELLLLLLFRRESSDGCAGIDRRSSDMAVSEMCGAAAADPGSCDGDEDDIGW
jgi:hypothetical protein